MTGPPRSLMRAFGLSHPALAATTALAAVWRVRRASGESAALKVWHGGDMANEAAGLDLLAAWDGAGAARLLGRAPGAALIEWLDGPSLGDLFRGGRVEEADRTLAAAAARLHGLPLTPDAPRLGDWFAALFDLAPAESWPGAARGDLARAQRLAERLLSSQRNVATLHGDIHHDNVRRSAEGWRAFDPKGVVGERAYDLANAFRNPKGGGEAVWRPERLRRLAALAAATLESDPARMLEWAAAKCALSIAWRAGPSEQPLGPPPDGKVSRAASLPEEADRAVPMKDASRTASGERIDPEWAPLALLLEFAGFP